VVADLVKAHGGRIDLESEPGAGTAVVLRWPAAEERDGASAHPGG
jgi:signal transduction histidine kinase